MTKPFNCQTCERWEWEPIERRIHLGSSFDSWFFVSGPKRMDPLEAGEPSQWFSNFSRTLDVSARVARLQRGFLWPTGWFSFDVFWQREWIQYGAGIHLCARKPSAGKQKLVSDVTGQNSNSFCLLSSDNSDSSRRVSVKLFQGWHGNDASLTTDERSWWLASICKLANFVACWIMAPQNLKQPPFRRK